MCCGSVASNLRVKSTRKSWTDDLMMTSHAAHVIVIGNEKGGAGKSTIALHLAVGLMQLGFKVAVADFDIRQRSLHRYLDNRRAYNNSAAICSLLCPTIYELPESFAEPNFANDRLDQVEGDLRSISRKADFLIVDTPGSVTEISKLAHSFADTVITPMNDSLMDLDVLARIAPGQTAVSGPSHYSLLMRELKRRRLREHGSGIEWIILRNRLAPIASANNLRVGRLLDALAPKLGFRVAPGIAERVIYRELFSTGATVLDPIELVAGLRPTMSHLSARMEVRRLLEALWLPQVTQRATVPAHS